MAMRIAVAGAGGVGHAMVRADQLLVARGLAPSRTLAQRLIHAGRVSADGAPVRKASELLRDGAPLAVAPGEEDRFASRGGLKLAGALRDSGVDPRGLVCLDVGQSTGGFTDCLLQAGARRIVGIDVGHAQLHPRLRDDPRVTCIEGVNARAVAREALGDACPAGGFDLVVVDVSFISLTLVLHALAGLAAPAGTLLALVKPQFEVGRDGLDGRGLVRSTELYRPVREQVLAGARDAGWEPLGWFDSPIAGGDGNREFFLHARRTDAAARAASGARGPVPTESKGPTR
jgi:23S rRNA (cytidine1920-2'-O)/16S rRNA (cytidine1409-2'-O)-methyltransferase